MLWIVGVLIFLAWFILKVLLHKSGGVHILLLLAISFCVTQFIQDRRTRAHRLND